MKVQMWRKIPIVFQKKKHCEKKFPFPFFHFDYILQKNDDSIYLLSINEGSLFALFVTFNIFQTIVLLPCSLYCCKALNEYPCIEVVW